MHGKRARVVANVRIRSGFQKHAHALVVAPVDGMRQRGEAIVVLIVERGGRAASYSEAAGAQAMAPEEISISISLNRGNTSETVWTTDLTYEYVRINAEYRT